jgi:hypothetical protein
MGAVPAHDWMAGGATRLRSLSAAPASVCRLISRRMPKNAIPIGTTPAVSNLKSHRGKRATTSAHTLSCDQGPLPLEANSLPA